MYSLLIKGGNIIDGTGNPAYKADLAVQGDKIVAIEPTIEAAAEKVIEADGLFVAPGFIDIHTHTDRSIFEFPLADSKVLQGVTTDVTGNCGIGLFPVASARKTELENYLGMVKGKLPEGGISWTDLNGFAAAVESVNPGINLVPLVPHGSLRIAVMGSSDRKPTDQEMQDMEIILADCLNQGAWGMSTGLIYPPGSFAKTDELVRLAQVLARYGAIYSSHVRGESGTLLQAVDEAIQIGRESGTTVEVSHLKAIGKPNWGNGVKALQMIEEARRQGVDIWADQYPYEASSTSLTALIPAWAHDGGVAAMLQRLVDPSCKEKLITGIGLEMNVRGGADRVLIAGLAAGADQELVGKTVQQIAEILGLTPEETVMQLTIDAKGGVSAVYFSIGEEDLETILKNPDVAVGSDGSGINPTTAEKATHPRSYGTFARVLGRYVREKKLLTWESAVRKMTLLPAQRLGLKDRGMLQAGLAADITVFNPDTVTDCAVFENPHQFAQGFEYVVVNGILAAEHGRLTGATAGRVLRKA